MKIMSRFFVVSLSLFSFSYELYAMEEEQKNAVEIDLVKKFGKMPQTFGSLNALDAFLSNDAEPLWEKSPKQQANFLNEQYDKHKTRKSLIVNTGIAAAAAQLMMNDCELHADMLSDQDSLKKQSRKLQRGFCASGLVAGVGLCGIIYELWSGNKMGQLIAGGTFVAAGTIAAVCYGWNNNKKNAIKKTQEKFGNESSGCMSVKENGGFVINQDNIAASLAYNYAMKKNNGGAVLLLPVRDVFLKLGADVDRKYGTIKQKSLNWPLNMHHKTKKHDISKIFNILSTEKISNLVKPDSKQITDFSLCVKYNMEKKQDDCVQDGGLTNWTSCIKNALLRDTVTDKVITQDLQVAKKILNDISVFCDYLHIDSSVWTLHERVLFLGIANALSELIRALEDKWDGFNEGVINGVVVIAKKCLHILNEKEIKDLYKSEVTNLYKDFPIDFGRFSQFLYQQNNEGDINIYYFIKAVKHLLSGVSRTFLEKETEKMKCISENIENFLRNQESYAQMGIDDNQKSHIITIDKSFTFEVIKGDSDAQETEQGDSSKKEKENEDDEKREADALGSLYYIKNDSKVLIDADFFKSKDFTKLSLLEKQICHILWDMVEKQNNDIKEVLKKPKTTSESDDENEEEVFEND